MAKTLPLKQRVGIASAMAHRAFTHLALWRVTALTEGRERYRAAINEHWEHLRFLEHGQLVAAVVELHSMLDASEATVNLPKLLDEVEAEHGEQQGARAQLRYVQPYLDRLRPLRNAVYAHRTKRKTSREVFAAAEMTPDRLHEMGKTCLLIANDLCLAVGLEPQAPSPLPADWYARMLRQLMPTDSDD